MIYNGEHSITFDNEVNTWNDWHLIPTLRPSINPPSVKSYGLETNLKNGIIDLTEIFHKGIINYGNNEGNFEFMIDNTINENFSNMIYSKIMNFIHGKNHEMFLDDDPDKIYYGRFSVDSFNPDQYYSKIVIGYNISLKK